MGAIIKPLKILGFLQNAWFPSETDERHIIMYRDCQEFHRRLLKSTMSGHRLHMAFGDLYGVIHWDNVGPAAIGNPDGLTKPDMRYVEKIIKQVAPDLILAFGNSARDAVTASIGAINREVMYCHHPNARHHFQAELDAFAQSVRVWLRETNPIKLTARKVSKVV